ncbi:hypothetical protein PENFLA_c032G09297 [Penicillium flavigenum]|uniref:Retrovirus-related Pol polyprotein from transposon TNT 1-94-like beta-barrel domain-containing protein n=1 Tax=Penicillium flavigenum TaxID=254877 RepID=A0A1V6SMQ7_9EURO|nr:hypothetical protein PENFLA_c032G09297 [Penicillium flavigenum]
MSPEFHLAWVVSVETSLASEKSDEEKQAEFGNLLYRYKFHWLITHGKAAAQKGLSKAVFHGHQEAQPGSTSASTALASKSAKKNSDLPVEKRSCPCSMKTRHAPWRCYAAYPEDKPEYMDTHPHRKQAWDKVMKENPDWKAFVDKKRAAERPSSKSEEPRDALSALQSGELASFTMHTERQPASSLMREPAMIEDDHSVINHGHSMFQQESYNPIRDRWLIGTGTQTHVCNDRKLFITFEETESSMRVGDTETIVSGVGTVRIYGISPRDETPKKLMLFNVKYSPGFHTNLISHGLMYKKTGAFLNFKENWIQLDGVPLYATYQDQYLSWLVQPRMPTVPILDQAQPELSTQMQDPQRDNLQDAEMQDPDRTNTGLQGSGGRKRDAK